MASDPIIRAVFLDRDGVINRKAPAGMYVTRWDQMQFLSGTASAIVLLNKAGFHVFVASNQRCVAKGLISSSDLEALHQRMWNALAAANARIDGVYYCPHEKTPPCGCRKPAPGMLLRAAGEHHIDLTRSWMVGDSKSDVEAGKNAGCKTAYLKGHENAEGVAADVLAPSLLDAVHQILTWEAREPDRANGLS